MANTAASELGDSNQHEAELDMALNMMRFVTAAGDPELAQYVHGKVCDSYRRITKLSSQSPSEDMLQRALQTLEQRIKAFQAGISGPRQSRNLA